MRRAGVPRKWARRLSRRIFWVRFMTYSMMRDMGLRARAKHESRRALARVEVLALGLGVTDQEVLAAGLYMYLVQMPAAYVHLTPRSQEIGRRAYAYAQSITGCGNREAALGDLRESREAYLVCMADQYTQMLDADNLAKEKAAFLFRGVRDDLLPLRDDAPEVVELFEAVLVQRGHLAAAPQQLEKLPALEFTPSMSARMATDVSKPPGEESGLRSWSTFQHVTNSFMKGKKDGGVIRLSTAAVVKVTMAIQCAEAGYGNSLLLKNAGRLSSLQAVRRMEVLIKGLHVTDSQVLSAAALVYLCNQGLRNYLLTTNASFTGAVRRGYQLLGGDRVNEIAQFTCDVNGAGAKRRGTPEYEVWLDRIAGDVEAMLVLLSDNYAFGEVLHLMTPGSIVEIYRVTQDVLARAKLIEGINEVFDPWLAEYAPLVAEAEAQI